MPFTRIRLNVTGPVAVLALVGSDAGNLIDEVMAAELREALTELDDDHSVRAVVLTGNGPDFSLGTALPGQPSGEQIASYSAASAIAAVGKATVAAIEGDALGQGLELALACDLRIAGATARFGLTRPDSPGIPWDGGTQRLPRLIGRSRALEMALLSRVITAEEAAAIGLVGEITEPGQALPQAIKAGEVIATHGPVAVRYLKEAVYKGADLALDQAMRLEVDLATLLHSTTDRSEGLRAFAEKRTPEFLGE
jgi:enoyl-CoA hydratase/carnithine racemase